MKVLAIQFNEDGRLRMSSINELRKAIRTLIRNLVVKYRERRYKIKKMKTILKNQLNWDLVMSRL